MAEASPGRSPRLPLRSTTSPRAPPPGRWNSDIAKIYQRTIAQEQLDGAAHMTGASGSDLESLIIGWSQPATV